MNHRPSSSPRLKWRSTDPPLRFQTRCPSTPPSIDVMQCVLRGGSNGMYACDRYHRTVPARPRYSAAVRPQPKCSIESSSSMFTQECRRFSYTECRGLGKRGSGKWPTATAIASGAIVSPLSPLRVNVAELPSIATLSRGNGIWRYAQVRPHMSGEVGRRSTLRYVCSRLNPPSSPRATDRSDSTLR